MDWSYCLTCGRYITLGDDGVWLDAGAYPCPAEEPLAERDRPGVVSPGGGSAGAPPRRASPLDVHLGRKSKRSETSLRTSPTSCATASLVIRGPIERAVSLPPEILGYVTLPIDDVTLTMPEHEAWRVLGVLRSA